MSEAALDALLETLAAIELHADEAFELDAAINLLEAAASLLQNASREDRERIIARAAIFASQTNDSEKKEFLANIGENLGISV